MTWTREDEQWLQAKNDRREDLMKEIRAIALAKLDACDEDGESYGIVLSGMTRETALKILMGVVQVADKGVAITTQVGTYDPAIGGPVWYVP